MGDLVSHSSLQNTQEQNEIIGIDDHGRRKVNHDHSLVGKLIIKRVINMGLVAKSMQQQWRPVGGMITEELMDNTVIFRFNNPFERRRIFNEGPWHFEKHLMVLKEIDQESGLYECEFWVQIWNVPYSYLTRNTAQELGKRLGRIAKIDVDHQGNIKGDFIRIKVGIDVDKPLKFIIKSNMGGKEVTLNLMYEKLENFCYTCGKMDHVLSECGKAVRYGPWLRAPNEDAAVHVRSYQRIVEMFQYGAKEIMEMIPQRQWLRKETESEYVDALLTESEYVNALLTESEYMDHYEQEQKTEENVAAHLYTVIKVARDEDLFQQIGRNVYFDLVDYDKVRSFCVQDQMPFIRFKEEVAKEFGVPAQHQRFWLWAKRQNHSYRPHRPLTHLEENLSVGQLTEVVTNKVNPEIVMFLEIERDLDSLPVTPPPKTKDDILLFFKLYDPFKQELSYIGNIFVKAQGIPIEILTKLNEMAGYALDEEIDFYEEIRFEPNVMCGRIDTKSSFRSSQLEDGDIIFIQKSLPAEVRQQLRYPDVPSFLEYMHSPQIVRFRSLKKPNEDEFYLELSKMYSYDEVVERVGERIGGEDPSKIRITPHNCYSHQPKTQPIKYRGVDTLSDMLVHYNQTSDTLYYEVLDRPLPELQGLKILEVAFHHATKHKVRTYIIKLPKESTVGDVIKILKTKVEMSHPDAELRLLQVFYSKIYKIFLVSDKVDDINDQYWTLRAEEIPEEEKNLGPSDHLIHVYHFKMELVQEKVEIRNLGDPFVMVIHEGDTLAETKVRIHKKLRVSDEEFSKLKFGFLSLGRLERLVDADILSNRQLEIYGDWEHYLGVQHTDSPPKISQAPKQRVVEKLQPRMERKRLSKTKWVSPMLI